MIAMVMLIHASIKGFSTLILMRASDNCGWNFTPMRGYDNGGCLVAMMRGYVNQRKCLCMAVLVVVLLSTILPFFVSAPLMVLLPLLSCYCHSFTPSWCVSWQ